MNTDINEISILYEEMILTESLEPRYPENVKITTTNETDRWGNRITKITYKFTTSKNNKVAVKFTEEQNMTDDGSDFADICFTVNNEVYSDRTERDIEILSNVIGILLKHIDKYESVHFVAYADNKDIEIGKNRRFNIYTKIMDKYFSSKWNIQTEDNDFILDKK